MRFMALDNAFRFAMQANGGATDARSGGPGASFMPKLGRTDLRQSDSEERAEALKPKGAVDLHTCNRLAFWASEEQAHSHELPVHLHRMLGIEVGGATSAVERMPFVDRHLHFVRSATKGAYEELVTGHDGYGGARRWWRKRAERLCVGLKLSLDDSRRQHSGKPQC